MVLTCALVTCALVLLTLDARANIEKRESNIGYNTELDPTCLLDARIMDFNVMPMTVNLSEAGPSLHSVSENLIAEVNYESLKSNPPAATKTQYFSYITSPPTAHSDKSGDDDLRQIIEQIRSVKIEQENTPGPEDGGPGFAEGLRRGEQTTEDGGQKTEDGIRKTEDGQKTRDEGPLPTTSRGRRATSDELSDEVMRDIEEATKKPGQIRNPLGMAEILFKTGKLKPAAICYKQALAGITPGDANEAHQRDWILFQIGNCLQYDDPNGARESYAELLRTSPDSPWADAARSRHDLVEWLQNEQPRKLIEELKK